MARYISTTFGNIKGKHGTAVSSVRNGKVVLRVFSPPSNPNSPAQVAQRLKFGLVVSSLSPLRNIINVGFGSKNGYYQAVSLALRKAVTGSSPDFSIEYANVLVASGSLPQTPTVTLTAKADMYVTLTWDATTWENSSSKDAVHLAFLNPVTNMVYFAQGLGTRESGELTFPLHGKEPPSMPGYFSLPPTFSKAR